MTPIKEDWDPSWPNRKVFFLVVRRNSSPEWITAALGLAPDSSMLLPKKQPTEAVWRIESKGFGNDDLSLIIESVLSRVRELKDRLRKLNSSYNTRCMLQIVQYVDRSPVGPGFYLSPDDVALLAELGAAVDVDQYWAGGSQ